MLREIHSADELSAHLDSGKGLACVRLQDVDLTGPVADRVLAGTEALDSLVVLGGQVPPSVADRLRARGAILFPNDPSLPFDAYRSHLYRADDLYAHLDGGYASTPDARTYAWSRERHLMHDAYASAMRALHDESMRDALQEALDGTRTVGIMGGHAMPRTSAGYREIAHLAHDLAESGRCVLTGGGPGAMEAANLGAAARTGDLDAALDTVAAVDSFRPSIDAWARTAFAARDLLGAEGDVRSVGIPTWFYGHEPPNAFGDVIAKFFSNAVREDLLLSAVTDAIVVLEGAAGTVQEIFQCVTPMYYAPAGTPLPELVLVGRAQWTRTVPVWDALTALGAGRALGEHLHLVDDASEALAVVTRRRA